MTHYFVTTISVIALLASPFTVQASAPDIPAEKNFPSSVGEVPFKHQKHVDEGTQCNECHHEINANKLKTPHPNYLKSSAVKCETCHNDSEKAKQKVYTCSKCHPVSPVNIADETLSAKVVIHKQCWECHNVGTAKKASKRCEMCHSGKKTVRTNHG